jgi:uncharacterized protein YbbK (DUF523 family)
MTDKKFLRNLRFPTEREPLRILVSACLTGVLCGVDGTSYGEYPTVLKLVPCKNVKLIKFCPEEFSFGTPREMCDIHGGNGMDVLNGKAKVLTESGVDWTEGMIKASEKMLQVAQHNHVELCLMMDISAACGSQVIYDGNRMVPQHEKKYQIGMGVCAAQLTRHGFNIVSQRDLASLEILYAKIDPNHLIDPEAKDYDQQPWYMEYFKMG